MEDVKEEEGEDIVQFIAPIFYTNRDDGTLPAEIMRVGNFQGRCAATLCTEDGTATDGDDYVAVSRQVVFQEGNDVQTVDIKITAKSGFETTEEFKLKLSDPVNCKLGAFLHTCRVKVCGRGCFPSQRYAKYLERGMAGIEEIGGWRLFIEFQRLVYQTEGMPRRLALTLILSQIPNLYIYICLWISVYLVDSLFDKEEQPLVTGGPLGGRIYTAYILAALYFVPVLVIFLSSVVKAHIDLGGHISSMLKMHMVRKFLNFNDESRQFVGQARVQTTIVVFSDQLARSLLVSMDFAAQLGKVAVIFLFCAMKDQRVLVASCIMPLVMCAFGVVQTPSILAAESRSTATVVEMSRAVHEVSDYFRMIAEYQKRPVAEDQVRTRDMARRHANNSLQVVHANNRFLGRVLGPLFIAIHIALHAECIITGEQKLGTFVATISVFHELGNLYCDVYVAFLTILSSHGALTQVTEFLNLPVDLPQRKALMSSRAQGFKAARREIILSRQQGHTRGDGSLPPSTDMVDIKLVDMCFSFSSRALFQSVNITQQQGAIVAVCGDHGSGKSTLMRILATSLMPTSGSVFVPSHLRTVYIEQRASVLNMTAWENLTFGDPNASPARVMDILADLRLHYVREVVAQNLKEAGRWHEVSGANGACKEGVISGNLGFWYHQLSYAEAAKVHLARALIMSPEVLIMQRPLGNFSFAERGPIMDMLTEFVRARGYRLPQESTRHRRPRTLFFSPTWRQDLQEAEVVWDIQALSVSVKRTSELNSEELHHLFSGLPMAGNRPDPVRL